MTAIFHVGTHKTATTSIQRYLSSHRLKLKDENICYPKYSDLIDTQVDHYAHLDLARSIDQRKSSKFSVSELESMFKAINNIQKHKFLIISAEPFWRIGFKKKEDDLFACKAQKLAQYFSVCPDTNIAITIRARSDFMLSEYSENILQTNNTHTFHEYISQNAHLFDYESNIKLWNKFGPVSLIPFESLKLQQNIGLTFINLTTGKNPTSLANTTTKFANASLKYPLLLYKFHLNKRGYSAEEGKQIVVNLSANLNKYSKDFLKTYGNLSWENFNWWSSNFCEEQHSELLIKYPCLYSPTKLNSCEFPALEAERQSLEKVSKTTESQIVNYLDLITSSTIDKQ